MLSLILGTPGPSWPSWHRRSSRSKSKSSQLCVVYAYLAFVCIFCITSMIKKMKYKQIYSWFFFFFKENINLFSKDALNWSKFVFLISRLSIWLTWSESFICWQGNSGSRGQDGLPGPPGAKVSELREGDFHTQRSENMILSLSVTYLPLQEITLSSRCYIKPLSSHNVQKPWIHFT